MGAGSRQKLLWEPVPSAPMWNFLLLTRRMNRRLEALEELNKSPMLRDEIREYLNPIYDLERLISRISYQSANPRDLVAFASSLEMLPHIQRS